MKRNHATAAYALTQISIWGTYGFLFTYANPYMTEKLGLSDTLAGWLLCLATALACLLQPLLTAVADRTRWNVRRILLCSGVLTALCAGLTLLPGLSTAAYAVLFASACVFLQIQPSFSNALGMEGIHGGMHINFAVARGIGSVSFGVAAKLAALLIGVMGMNGASLLGAASSLLLVAAVLLMPKGRRLVAKTEEAPTSAREFFQESPKMAVLLVGIMLLYVGHNVLSNCMFRIAQWKVAGGDNATSVQGTAMMIAAVVELPTMFLFTKLVKRFRCDLLVVAACRFMTLRLVLSLLLPGQWGLYLAQLAQVPGYALFAVSTVYYVGTVVPKRNVVKGQTYLGVANTLGGLLAFALGGSLIDAIGVPWMLAVCAGLSALGLFLAGLSLERVERTVGTA